jgi:hypothetical protein
MDVIIRPRLGVRSPFGRIGADCSMETPNLAVMP